MLLLLPMFDNANCLYNLNEPWHGISNNVVCETSKASDQPEHMRSLIRAFASRCSLNVKPTDEHNLEFLSLKGSCTGSSKSTLVKMSYCWKITCHGSNMFKPTVPHGEISTLL